MMTKGEIFAAARKQLALEYHAAPEDFTRPGFTLTLPHKPPGVRIYSPEAPFFAMASTGNSVVATAAEPLHSFLQGLAPAVRISPAAGHRPKTGGIGL